MIILRLTMKFHISTYEILEIKDLVERRNVMLLVYKKCHKADIKLNYVNKKWFPDQ